MKIRADIEQAFEEKRITTGDEIIPMLKEELKERIEKRGADMGVPGLFDMIADETVGITEEEILPFLQEKKHPALDMDPIIG